MKIGIVGTGGVAVRHLGVLKEIEGLELVGHVSATRARAEAQAATWGGRPYTELETLLDREQPQAVWLCVTPDRHGAVEEALIARGVPFFVEKPLAADEQTPERIAGLLLRTPVVTGVGYKLRALDNLPRVRALLAERPARMVLGAWHGSTPAAAWWQDVERSGGQIVEQAAHLVDLARLLVGEPEVLSALATHRPRARYPRGNVPEVTAALLRFPDHVPGTLTATCLLEGTRTAALQLVCEGRMVTVAEGAVRVENGREVDTIPAREDPYLREDAAFVRAVREGNPSGVFSSYADALLTHRHCWAIRRAAGRSSRRR